jgi:hypothetical protein
MHTLSICHSLTPDGGHLVAVDYNPGGRSTGFSQPVPFTFELTESDRSRLRFYMEEVLKYPDAETRDVARRIEADMECWGEEMFRQLPLGDG